MEKVFIYYDYATQKIKQYSKIAYDYFLQTGTKKIKVNRIIFDFSKELSDHFTAFSQDTTYLFDVIEGDKSTNLTVEKITL